MRYVAYLLLALLTGCSVDVAAAGYFRSGDAVAVPGPKPFYNQANKEGASVYSAPIPTLPEVKDESALSAENRGLFAPGREPM